MPSSDRECPEIVLIRDINTLAPGKKASPAAHLGPHQVLDIRYDILDTDMLRVVHPQGCGTLLGILWGKFRSRSLFTEVNRQRMFDLRLFKRNRFDCEERASSKHCKIDVWIKR
jgi:hypothetical protein